MKKTTRAKSLMSQGCAAFALIQQASESALSKSIEWKVSAGIFGKASGPLHSALVPVLVTDLREHAALLTALAAELARLAETVPSPSDFWSEKAKGDAAMSVCTKSNPPKTHRTPPPQ